MKNIVDMTRDALGAANVLTVVSGVGHESYLSRQALELRKTLDVLFGRTVGAAIYRHWYDKMTECHYSDHMVLRQYNEHGHLTHYHGFYAFAWRGYTRN